MEVEVGVEVDDTGGKDEDAGVEDAEVEGPVKGLTV